MEVKKTTKADLNKRTVFFLQIGLILVLLLAYFIVQWRSYETAEINQDQFVTTPIEELEIPITILPTPPPPEIPVAPDEIKLILDDEDIEEDPIKSSEIDNEPIAEMEDIKEVKKVVEVETVPFILIEDVPIFPGCESLSNNVERKNCMSEKITKFINKEFNTALGSQLGLKGINKINVMFKIDTNGDIVDIGARAPHPKLEEEAKRVIQALPKMKPGKQRGNPVIVQYAIPIIFKVQE
ncbi:protein TonB [Gillisia mitskevichiae]|uniref:Protein TonB n=1 Tax=Gillisia mitskevichiae TaxID=270921 RepID=A0A495PTK5_9FLAO|nr:energy transducer TonB [Gillisia mitskevichiae]RKS53934.1 protein TonB [Gillisia mitskevichiae]